MMNERDRTPQEIEEDIERARSEIGDILNVIQEKLSPGKFASEAINHVSSGAGEFASNLGRTARDNPIPVVLIGLGFGFLLMAPERRRQTSRRDSVRESDIETSYFASRLAAFDKRLNVQPYVTSPEERFKRHQDFISSIAARTEGIGDDNETAVSLDSEDRGRIETDTNRGGAKAKRLAAGVQEEIRRTRIGVRKRTKQMKRVLAGTLKKQPIALGALGLAIGAVIGAVIPAMNRADKDRAGGPRNRHPMAMTTPQPGERAVAPNVGSKKAKRRGGGSDEPGRAAAKSNAGTKTFGAEAAVTGKSKA